MPNVLRKHYCSLAVTRLEGLPQGIETAIELKWNPKPKRSGKLFSFPSIPFLSGKNREIVSVSERKFVGREGAAEWQIDGEAGRIDNAYVSYRFSDRNVGSEEVSISVLYGRESQGKNKPIGTVRIKLAKYISIFKYLMEGTKKVPITLRIGNIQYNGLLYVDVKMIQPVSENGRRVD